VIEIEGWISLHRKLLENPIVCKDSDHLAVWIYLLLNATHTKYDVYFNNKRLTLKPGQLLTGRKSISSKIKVSESKVQRILKTFESEQQIEQQTTSQNRLISILNWGSYQNSEQRIEQQLNNERTTTEQLLNTNNKDNKDNKDNNEKINRLFEEVWKLYPNKKGKSSISKTTKNKIYKAGEQDIKKAIDNFKDYCSKNDWYTPMHGSKFFNGAYEDYLGLEEEQKEKVDLAPKPNDFSKWG